jgi:hypothetical protein
MHTLRCLSGTALLLLASAAARPTAAAEVLHTPDAIRACLCLDQAVTAASDALYQETETYDAAKTALAELERRADAARQNADPTDAAQRDALGRLLDERDAAVTRFAAAATPQFNAAVERYNEAARAFNRGCGDKAYDWSVLPDVQRTLACEPAK